MELPRFAIITIIKIRKNRFLKKPFKEKISSGTLFTSWTVGFRRLASTSPVNHPQATRGFREEKGAIIKEVRMLRGCPRAMAVKSAANELFQRNQEVI